MNLEVRRIMMNDRNLAFISNKGRRNTVLSLDELGAMVNSCRVNALAMVCGAGSGHIGTSFSVAEIFGVLKFSSLGLIEELIEYKDSIFFSSKGHDAPMLYAIFHAAGDFEDEFLFKLRRIGGLPGHPTIDVPGVIANTGSLGMGISKAKGMVYANRLMGLNVRVNVVLGDGELQEGQIWESLSSAARDKLEELTVIVDANQIQSDTWVENTLSLGDIRARVEAMGWDYFDVDGHSLTDLVQALSKPNVNGRPKWIQARTVKGKGVDFMESFPTHGEFYKFHSGAPSVYEYEEALRQLLSALDIDESIDSHLRSKISLEKIDHMKPKTRVDSIVDDYADELLKFVTKFDNVVVMDADLTYDTGTYKVKAKIPSRYVQCGIAEQDMVSTAGGIALRGFKPIVHSFSTFLTMRAYEQIFNNSTEKTSVTYVGFLAGIIPAPPGVSHQAVTDSPIMSVIPEMKIFEPATKAEIACALEKALRNDGPSYIRIQSVGDRIDESGSVREKFTLWGRTASRVLLICSGLTSLSQALIARDLIEDAGHSCSVASVFDHQIEGNVDITDLILMSEIVFVIENSLPGNLIFRRISNILISNSADKSTLTRVGLDDFPVCGQNQETLSKHGLDGRSLAHRVLESLK